MNPPSFPLKTGFSNLLEPVTLTANQKETLEKLLLVFLKQAISYAGEYTKAAGRKTVLVKDIRLGLKTAALPTENYCFWTQPNFQEKIEEIEQLLQESDEDSEDDGRSGRRRRRRMDTSLEQYE